jgi:UDP-GlcNAc:undecaprenyl-phosphate GlcNAc-1-phosphate transferase
VSILLYAGLAFLLSLALVPLVRRISFRMGKVAAPREDRWHRKPTPQLGGIAIYTAFLGSLLMASALNGSLGQLRWGLLASSSLIFLLGLYDDLRELAPPTKLMGQIIVAAVVVFQGYTTNFFTPKIPDTIVAQLPNILLTFLWLAGITNAINLLDNMDGLAGGIALITAGFLIFFFWQGGDPSLLAFAAALAGAALGFLVFNFPPASIFMGDSGSLFLGFTLAVLAIARQPQASNVFAVLGVPTLLFLLPILDTTLVTITRLLRGQSPAQGGRDHTSHRLIAFGLSERQALMALYGVAIIAGVAGIAIETLDYWLSLVLVPALVLSLALLAAYLGGLKVVNAPSTRLDGPITRLMVELTYRRHTFEITLDFFVIGLALYLAYWTNNSLSMNDESLQLYLTRLPIALAGTYLSFYLFRIYRGVWRYVGVGDLVRYAAATAGSVALAAIITSILLPGENFSAVVLILFAVFLFLGLAATRSSFKALDQIYKPQLRAQEARVLIVGAGDAGEMALRWMQMNPQFGYRPIGFLDEDPYAVGRLIHGVDILGGFDQLDTALQQRQADGVIIAEYGLPADQVEKLIRACRARNCWVRALRLEFQLLE